MAEAIIMSGFPKSTNIIENILRFEIAKMEDFLVSGLGKENKHIERVTALGSVEPGTGHDCFLKGIVVTGVAEIPQHMAHQIARYHWWDIISSQSTMHKITQMDIARACSDEVDIRIINIINDYVDQHNKATSKEEKHMLFRRIINNYPHGLHLTVGFVTNYLQLKTMRLQRKYHKMEEWKEDFITWTNGLPYFTMLIGEEDTND
jgi:hypothetical protein